MARLARLYIPGLPQIAMQTGIQGQPIFTDDEDRAQFLSWLKDAQREEGVAIHAYALLLDNFYLLVSPQQPGDLARVVQAVGRRYVSWFNRKHRRSGTLWQGRYRSAVIAPQSHFLPCSWFIDDSPVRLGLANKATDYRWSSAGHHSGLHIDSMISTHPQMWDLGNTPFERQASYRNRLDVGLPREVTEKIAAAIRSGWLLTDDLRATHWSDISNRRHHPLERGRPRKAQV